MCSISITITDELRLSDGELNSTVLATSDYLFSELNKSSGVFIHKNAQYHIADILTSAGLVIEIQNSLISTIEIFERENFYGKMIWMINSKEFKENLKLKAFSYDIFKQAWFTWITPCLADKDKAYAITISP